MDVFTWSVPFLAEKVTNMLYNIVKKGEEPGDLGIPEDAVTDPKMKRKLVMKSKVSSVAKINKMYATLREQSELLLQIKNMSPDGKIPRGLLLQGKPAIRNGKE